ncbi:hypothetical protein BDV37DRAFT_104371 [Aspergillus pseudonomiae]|uniref:Lysine-specific metallo-endopeptidase domain-containing protein n=1 Tax=Aspergillus pseudonomiae TaxID=1506151 RepID=A0A5N7DE12_9EURO|nr:uncharacterized protein BDV37DRAFT_104371 [Aspergillus pseudonomiae]KAE8404690.1 hypothetical protein BDV37DRAFT_104371 [Aspergillus pseudonomiae]
MKVRIHFQSFLNWTVGIQLFLWTLLLPYTTAFPFEIPPDLAEYALKANDSGIPHRHLSKKALDYPGVTFSSTCDGAQQRYIKEELDEIKLVLVQAQQQLRIIRNVIKEKEQPKDWGTRYSENRRLLNTFQRFIGWIKFNPATKELPEQRLNSWVTIAQRMTLLSSIYQKIHQALTDSTLTVTIHCNDHFLVYQPEESDQTERVYKDTRPEGEASTGLRVSATAKLCHESESAHGWALKNDVTLKDEITICPSTFRRTNTANKLSQYANDMAALNGKTLDDMKFTAAAGTLLHELTHCEHILGEDKTGDQVATLRGRTRAAYQAYNIAALAWTRPELAVRNAGTLKHFLVLS